MIEGTFWMYEHFYRDDQFAYIRKGAQVTAKS